MGGMKERERGEWKERGGREVDERSGSGRGKGGMDKRMDEQEKGKHGKKWKNVEL